MRIAMLHVDLPTESRGGVAHQVSRLSDVLARRGHDVVVFTLSPPPSDVAYTAFRLPLPALARRRAVRLLSIPAAFAACRYRDFDIVHAHGDSQLLVRRRIPIVRTFYGSALDEARSAVRLRRQLVQRLHFVGEQVARRTASLTVGISRATESTVGRLDAIVPCGVDTELFHPGEKSPHPSILFVGTLSGRKRGSVLVDLFRRMIRPAVPDAELWLVTEDAVDGAGIQTWRRPDDATLAALYRRAWIFASPSAYEGFGVPYIEALASGTCVVARTNPGALELLGEGTGGTVVAEDALAPTLVTLLGDHDRRAALAELGRAHGLGYDWAVVAGRYEKLYRSILRGTEAPV